MCEQARLQWTHSKRLPSSCNTPRQHFSRCTQSGWPPLVTPPPSPDFNGRTPSGCPPLTTSARLQWRHSRWLPLGLLSCGTSTPHPHAPPRINAAASCLAQLTCLLGSRTLQSVLQLSSCCHGQQVCCGICHTFNPALQLFAVKLAFAGDGLGVLVHLGSVCAYSSKGTSSGSCKTGTASSVSCCSSCDANRCRAAAVGDSVGG